MRLKEKEMIERNREGGIEKKKKEKIDEEKEI